MMATVTMKLTDLGEGVSAAELIEWNVAVGDSVSEDDILATVMTDKAAVEIPSIADGKVVWLAGEPGHMIQVGSDLVRLDVGGATEATKAHAAPHAEDVKPAVEPPEGEVANSEPTAATTPLKITPTAQRGHETTYAAAPRKPLASPGVRRHAAELDVDLTAVTGSGPEGRVRHADLDAFAHGPVEDAARDSREIKLAGLRRLSAEKVALSKARIPHFTLVEEVDVTALEELRESLNAKHAERRGTLSVLPFVVAAIARAARDHPGVNGWFDDEAGVLRLSEAVHVGVATQTPAGLMVPVVRNAETNGLWKNAAEITRLAEQARQGRASREELTGSSITVTSLGPLGGVVSTPIINHPEVAIVGLNRIETRPVWNGREFAPRRVMNLSSSFDHRVIDGWDAALFVQALKTLLEVPALLFVDEE